MFARILKEWLILGISGIQRHHIRDREARFITRETLDNVSSTYLAFLINSEIKPAAVALVETPNHISAPESSPSYLFYVGILLAAVGTFLVLYSKEASEPAAPAKPAATAPEAK